MSFSVRTALRPAAAAPFRCLVAASRARCAFTTSSSLRRSDDAGSTAGELGVGELQGATFRIEPLRRVGEDDETKRARLLCMLQLFFLSFEPSSTLYGFTHMIYTQKIQMEHNEG